MGNLDWIWFEMDGASSCRDEGAAWWHTQYTGRRGIPGLSEGSGYVCVCACACVLSLALLFVRIMG